MLLAVDVTIPGHFSTDKHGAVFALAGWSGSGKTTLVEQLVAHLVGLGYDIATVKHAHHHFDADTPGKDSFRHRQAGSRQVLVSRHSVQRFLPNMRIMTSLICLISWVSLPRQILFLLRGLKNTRLEKLRFSAHLLANPAYIRRMIW